jgi:hypothetical protein
MTALEWLAYVGTPALLVATGLGVVWLTGWLDARRDRTPDERRSRATP